MAELLVFIRNVSKSKKLPGPGHWMDELSEKRIADMKVLDSRFEQKYNARLQPGDIIEVHEDGWWDWVMRSNPNNKIQKAFAVIKVPGKLEDYKHLTEPQFEYALNEFGDRIPCNIVKKHQYQVTNQYPMAGEVIELAEKSQLTVNDKKAGKAVTLGSD